MNKQSNKNVTDILLQDESMYKSRIVLFMKISECPVPSKTPFIWRKVVPGRRVTHLPELPLQNLANRLHEKQKVGSAGRVTCLAGTPFFNGRVTLLARLTFLHINTLARPAGSTLSRRDNQSMRERCWRGQRGQLFSHINSRCS